MEMIKETKFNKNEMTLQYNHGEYGLNFEIWELVPDRQFRYAVGWNYYRADEYSLIYSYRNIERRTNADINPRQGRRLELEVTYADDKLSSGEFEFAFKPIYDKNRFGRYQLSYELIYQLYTQIFDKINPETGLFTADEILPSAADIKTKIDSTVSSFVPKS